MQKEEGRRPASRSATRSSSLPSSSCYFMVSFHSNRPTAASQPCLAFPFLSPCPCSLNDFCILHLPFIQHRLYPYIQWRNQQTQISLNVSISTPITLFKYPTFLIQYDQCFFVSIFKIKFCHLGPIYFFMEIFTSIRMFARGFS